jgi:hypothetical protein
MTKGTGGAGYAQTRAWSDLFNNDTGLNISVKGEMDDTPEKYQLLKEGDFLASPITITESMLKAENPQFAERGLGAGQFRILYPLSTYYLGYAIQGDSGIKSPYDLKEKRVLYLSSFGDEGKDLIRPLLAWGHIEEDEVRWIPVDSTLKFGAYMRDGRGEVSYGSMIEPQWLEAESSPRGIKWIELDPVTDPAGAARFKETFSTNMSWGVCKQGVRSAMGVKTVEIVVSYYTTAQYDEHLVYGLVRWLHGNYDRYKDRHINFNTMTVDTLVKSAETDLIPLHDGTARYLRDLGIWNEDLETRRKQKIQNLTVWVDAFREAVKLAEKEGVAVSSENQDWLSLWKNYRTSRSLPLFR